MSLKQEVEDRIKLKSFIDLQKYHEKKWACINQNNIEDFRKLGYNVDIKPQKSVKDFLTEIGFK